ncbi:MAG: head-tail adaptor protein [Deltaproteobacteria bacterium HGW-Deltaproteobacteria-6]|jgi:SPP1 family predicted phage head-tail adaptor|nr:MAG: head-tail adaptor protein [Deltaproteobacteria bacterium HGW-Deltaproteobacteria-6]
MLRSGDLNKLIDIQAQTKASDSMGGFTTTWTTLAANVAAAIWDATSNERNQANATTLIITHRVRIRYRSIFRSAWRLKFGNRYFSIVSVVNPGEKNEYLDLFCKEAA